MANMTSREYDNYRDLLSNFTGTRDAMERLYRDIKYGYDDGYEMLRRLDCYNKKYRIDY